MRTTDHGQPTDKLYHLRILQQLSSQCNLAAQETVQYKIEYNYITVCVIQFHFYVSHIK